MENLLKTLVDFKTAAAVIAATVWGVLAVLGSPDKDTALILISIIVIGLAFAVYTVRHNNKQDEKLDRSETREKECNETLSGLRTAVAILHTRAAQNGGRRHSWPLPPLQNLIGEAHASKALEEANRYIPEQSYKPERRRKRR